MAHNVRLMNYVSLNRNRRAFVVNGVAETDSVPYSPSLVSACRKFDYNCRGSSLIVQSIFDQIQSDASKVLYNFEVAEKEEAQMNGFLNGIGIRDADNVRY
jgi:hypothetical protein